MKKFLIGLFCIAVSVPAYSDALDNLKTSVNKKKTEKIEQERKEKARQEHLADCKQAREKANARKQEIEKKSGGKVISGVSGKIVSVLSDGIFIENDCYSEYKQAVGVAMVLGGTLGNLYMNAAADCRENRRFVYTDKDNLFVDHKFSSEYLFVPMDGYKYTTLGGTTSVPSYKETAYKVSEIEYETYLKDKSNKTCPE